VNSAARQRGHSHQIAWALQDRPDLLTGGGADAPAPCVLRLVDLLTDAGSRTIVRPACPRAFQLAQRLRQLGLSPAQSRSTALFQLATELPAVVLARILGIHIAVAVAWRRASAGDWAQYSGEVSRRLNQTNSPPNPRK